MDTGGCFAIFNIPNCLASYTVYNQVPVYTEYTRSYTYTPLSGELNHVRLGLEVEPGIPLLVVAVGVVLGRTGSHWLINLVDIREPVDAGCAAIRIPVPKNTS